jgi:zinc transport system substrate-binding protein
MPSDPRRPASHSEARARTRWVARTLVAGLAACTALLHACDARSPDQGASSAVSGVVAATPERVRPLVAVTNAPLAAMVERIAGEWVDVELPIPSGVDPPFWKPEPEAVLRMQGADLVLLNGATYERWLPTVQLPMSRTVDTGSSFRGQLLDLADEVVHSHGPEGEHSHRGKAFTTWLDFSLAAQQARAVGEAIATRLPAIAGNAERAAAVRANAQALADQLRDLSLRCEVAGRHLQGQTVLASHPVFDYLARRAGLALQSVHWEPGEMPNDDEWQRFDALRAAHPATLMLWEGEPGEAVRRALEGRGVTVLVFDPAGAADNRGARVWLDAMEANVARLEAAAAAAAAGRGG